MLKKVFLKRMIKAFFSVSLSFFLVFDMRYALGTVALVTQSESFLEATKREVGYSAALNEFSKKLYDYSEEIDISAYRLPASELPRFISLALKDDPYLFFVDGGFKYKLSSDGFVTHITPSYSMTEQEYLSARRFCQEELKKIIYLIPEGADDFSKALFLHDHLCENFSYDSEIGRKDMYSFLKNGRGNCQGYTFTYTALLRLCDIRCGFAASDGIMHIWNLLELDGEWYHADVTWDDAISERRGYAGHVNFLCTDEQMKENGHGEWYTSNGVFCASEKYRYFIENRINTPMAYLDGVWYAAENSPSSRRIAVYDHEKSDSESLIKIKDTWENKSCEGQYYISSHTSVVAFAQRLYYNVSDAVFEYDVKTRESVEIYRAPNGKQIFGLSRSGGVMFCIFDTQGTECEVIFECVSGDVNFDGKINVRDLTTLSRSISDKDIFGQRFLPDAADLDLDGDADSDDLEELRRIVISET